MTFITVGDSDSGTQTTRRRRSKKTNPGNDENPGEPATKKRRLSGSESRSGRARTRPPSPPAFDPDADPGEELDPTVVTMAALCDDTGRGRVSSKAAQIVSNHAAWRAANREKRARMKAAMEAKKYGRNLDDEEEGATQPVAQSQNVESGETADPDPASSSATPAAVLGATTTAESANEEGDKGVESIDFGENLAVSRFNVQVRIGPNGETIIDEDSLFVNRDEEHQTEDYTHVEESDFTKFVNSSTYSKKVRGSRWSAEETELFFDVSCPLTVLLSLSCIDNVHRRCHNSARTMNSSHTFCRAVIVKHARTSSNQRTRGIQRESLTASTIASHMVRITKACAGADANAATARYRNVDSYDREGFLRPYSRYPSANANSLDGTRGSRTAYCTSLAQSQAEEEPDTKCS